MNPDIEATILGIILRFPEQSAPYAAQHFQAAAFSSGNRPIFEAIQKTFVATGTTSVVAVATELREQRNLEVVGGMERLCRLTDETGIPMMLPQLAEQARDESAGHRLADLGKELIAQLAGGQPVAHSLAFALETLDAITSNRDVHQAPTTKKLVTDAVAAIYARASGQDSGYSTGVGALDRATGGIRASSQWVIAGPAKGGKSSLAITFLASLSIAQAKRCAFFGMEMPSIENVERLLCHDSRLSASALRDGKLNEWHIGKLKDAAGKVATSPIHFRDDVFELVELISAIRALKAAFPDLFAVFVDYAQLVNNTLPGENREREVAGVSRALRKLSMQSGLAVVLLSQTNDDGKLRESRTIGMDATKILTLDFAETPTVRKVKLIQRDGMSGIEIELAYIGEHFLFADLANERD